MVDPRQAARLGFTVTPEGAIARELETERMVARILAALYSQPLFARPPAFIAPTLRSVPVEFSTSITIAPPGVGAAGRVFVAAHWTPQTDPAFVVAGADMTSNCTITDGGLVQEGFPRGWIGVVWASCAVCQLGSVDVLAARRRGRWSLAKNAQIVDGFARQIPGSTLGQQGSSVGPIPDNHASLESRTACPILLRGGDTMTFRFDHDDVAAGTLEFVGKLSGWKFPEADAGGDLAAYLAQ